jgi:hypothetical protein
MLSARRVRFPPARFASYIAISAASTRWSTTVLVSKSTMSSLLMLATPTLAVAPQGIAATSCRNRSDRLPFLALRHLGDQEFLAARRPSGQFADGTVEAAAVPQSGKGIGVRLERVVAEEMDENMDGERDGKDADGDDQQRGQRDEHAFRRRQLHGTGDRRCCRGRQHQSEVAAGVEEGDVTGECRERGAAQQRHPRSGVHQQAGRGDACVGHHNEDNRLSPAGPAGRPQWLPWRHSMQ